MRNWLRTLMVVISLTLMATTAMHVAAHGMAHTGLPHHDCAAQPDSPLADEDDSGTALPTLAAVYCSTVSLPAGSTIVNIWRMKPIAWHAIPVLEPAGRSPALDPQPPRL